MNKNNLKSKITKNNKTYKLNKLQLGMILMCFSIFILLAILVVTNNIKWFDDFVYGYISKLICKPMTMTFEFITFFSSIELITVFAVLILILSKNKKRGFIITTNILFCIFINQLFKNIFTRSRPVLINLIVQGGYSFPSGHAMTSMAFYGLLIYLIIKKDMNKSMKVILTILLSLLILLIGISRIYLGVHYASDVLAGFALSLGYLIIYINLLYKRFE